MKKKMKFSAAAALSLAALTPVAVFADEAPNALEDGFYTANGFVPMAEFDAMPKSEKKDLLLDNIENDLVLVREGLVFDLADEEVQNAKVDEVEEQAITPEEYTEKTGNTITPGGIETTLVVDSVSAINDTVLQSSDVTADYKAEFKLALEFLDADGEVIEADKLPSDLEVSFTDSETAFNTDGTIKDESKLGSAPAEITVVATVTSESQELSLTEEYKVTVVDATAYNEVTEAELMIDGDESKDGEYTAAGAVNVETAVVGDDLYLVPTKAVQNDGKQLDATKASNPDNVAWAGQVASVSSSNNAVLAVEYNTSKDTVVLRPISKGEATITVTLKSGKKYTETVNVETAQRKATNATATDLSLSTTEAIGNIEVVVTDQYGDPVKGETVYGYPSKTGVDSVVTVTPAATTEKGEVKLSVTATGSDTVKISTNADSTKAGLATAEVTFAEAGDVASYELRVATGSESDDGTLDLYNDDDNELKLQFIGKDTNGVVAKVYKQDTVGSTYTVTSSEQDVATVTIDSDGTIDVNPLAVGTTTITVKEGSITRATYTVTVENSIPSIGEVTLVNDAKLTAKASGSYTLDDDEIAKLVKVEDFELEYDEDDDVFYVLDGTTPIGYVELLTSNTNLLNINADGQTLETTSDFDSATKNVSAIFRLNNLDGSIVNSVSLKLTYDNVAPAKPVFTATAVNNDNKADYTLSGTAEAGSTVAVSLAAESNTATVITVEADSQGKWVADTIDVSALDSIADGNTINISVTATDAAGNVSEAAIGTVTYDISVDTPNVADGSSTATGFKTDADEDEIVSAEVVTGGTATDSGSVSVANGIATFNDITAETTETVFFTVTDAAGNTADFKATLTVAGDSGEETYTWAISTRS